MIPAVAAITIERSFSVTLMTRNAYRPNIAKDTAKVRTTAENTMLPPTPKSAFSPLNWVA